MASTGLHAINTGDLIDLTSTSPTNFNSHAATTNEAILTVLNAPFRGDLPYTRLGTSHLLAINLFKALSAVNDASAREYKEYCYRDTSPSLASAHVLQPHVYELDTILLNVEQRMAQRDLYAIPSSFIVETANHKIRSATAQDTIPTTQIIVVDQHGFQTRGPTELGQSYILLKG